LSGDSEVWAEAMLEIHFFDATERILTCKVVMSSDNSRICNKFGDITASAGNPPYVNHLRFNR
jgi:hypothetical protein